MQWDKFLKEFEFYYNYQFRLNYMVQYFETVNVNLDLHNYFLNRGYKPFTYKVKVGE